VSRQNILAFIGFSSVGITIWNAVLIGLGYKLGQHWEAATKYAKDYKYFLIPLVLFIIVTIVLRIRKIKREKKKVGKVI
jgi:membrane protein DedA with SNARE-associated domain